MKVLVKNALLAVLIVAIVLFIEEMLDFYKSPINLSDIGFTDE